MGPLARISGQMGHSPQERFPEDLRGVAARLRIERAEATPVELDRIKLTVMKRRLRAGTRPRRRGSRSSLLSPILAVILVIAGVAAIAGATTGGPTKVGASHGKNGGKHQYCDDDNHH